MIFNREKPYLYIDEDSPIQNDDSGVQTCDECIPCDNLSRLEEDARFHRVIKMIFNLLDLAGFYLDGRIVIVSKKTGRTWR